MSVGFFLGPFSIFAVFFWYDFGGQVPLILFTGGMADWKTELIGGESLVCIDTIPTSWTIYLSKAPKPRGLRRVDRSRDRRPLRPLKKEKLRGFG